MLSVLVEKLSISTLTWSKFLTVELAPKTFSLNCCVPSDFKFNFLNRTGEIYEVEVHYQKLNDNVHHW